MKKILLCMAACLAWQGYELRGAASDPDLDFPQVIGEIVCGDLGFALRRITYFNEAQREKGDRDWVGEFKCEAPNMPKEKIGYQGETLLQFAQRIDQNPPKHFAKGWLSNKSEWRQFVTALTPAARLIQLWSHSWNVHDDNVKKKLPYRWLSLRCLSEKDAAELYQYLRNERRSEVTVMTSDETKLLYLLSRRFFAQEAVGADWLLELELQISTLLPTSFFK